MKKPTIAVTGQKKGNYKRLADSWAWDNSVVVFDKEEKRGKRKSK